MEEARDCLPHLCIIPPHNLKSPPDLSADGCTGYPIPDPPCQGEPNTLAMRYWRLDADRTVTGLKTATHAS